MIKYLSILYPDEMNIPLHPNAPELIMEWKETLSKKLKKIFYNSVDKFKELGYITTTKEEEKLKFTKFFTFLKKNYRHQKGHT